jgi:hypothetical protein
VEISDVRKQLRQAIDRARRRTAERRARVDAAAAAYMTFLARIAEPVFRMFAMALKAEGHQFTVFTPADGVRLVSGRSGEDYVEITLDDTADEPYVLGRVSYARGRHRRTTERPVRERAAVDQLTEEDVLQFLLEEIGPFVAR